MDFFELCKIVDLVEVIMPIIDTKEFSQNPEAAIRAALDGPVFITEQGEISHVLLSCEDYNTLCQGKELVERLACPESAGFEFEPQKLSMLTRTEKF
jgi:hypothetical protein